MVNRLGVTAWLALVTLGAACDSSPRMPSTTSGATSGTVGSSTSGVLHGQLEIVTQLGEQCPQIPHSPNPRCDPLPRPGTGVEVRAVSGAVAATGTSAADGHLTITLVPGSYVVRGEPVAGYQFTPERHVEVFGGETSRVPLTYTNGIQ